METARPTFRDFLDARRAVYRHLDPTPLLHQPTLSDLLGAEVWTKHENHLPTGAFKVRGGVYLASRLDDSGRRAGLYTASTGNHAQSIAYGGRAASTAVTVAMPEGANPVKVAGTRALGAEVVLHGRDYDEAREWIAERAEEKGARFVGPADPELIVGVGSYVLEIMERLPFAEVILVPVGAGSGACACCLVAKHVNPDIEIIGVQSAGAPTQQHSWAAGRAVSAPMETVAEGLATRVPFEHAQRILRDPQIGLDDFVLVEDAELEEAIRLTVDHVRTLVEHAGAAALAAALRLRERLAGRRVVLVLSGGNLGAAALARILAGQS
jgi:threonine dehydratase